MSRLKTFGKYLLMFVAFYIFVTVASIGFIKGTYETMEQNVYSSEEIQIEVEEAKSTFVNGYVKGKLTNKTDSDIHSKYVNINFLSKKGNVILTKYLDIDEVRSHFCPIKNAPTHPDFLMYGFLDVNDVLSLCG